MVKRMLFTILISMVLCSSGINPVFAVLASDLNNVIAYPNPCKAKLGHTNITFGNLTSTIKLRVYKKTGELILDKDETTTGGNLVWDLKNNDGYPVASGVYVYIITNTEGQQSKGKLAILK